MDPLGADVGAANPYASSAQPVYAELMERDPVYGERGNALDIRGGCTLDGMAFSCSEAMSRLERGIGGYWSQLEENPQLNLLATLPSFGP